MIKTHPVICDKTLDVPNGIKRISQCREAVSIGGTWQAISKLQNKTNFAE